MDNLNGQNTLLVPRMGAVQAPTNCPPYMAQLMQQGLLEGGKGCSPVLLLAFLLRVLQGYCSGPAVIV